MREHTTDVAITFEPAADDTTHVSVHHSGFESAEERESHVEGWSGALPRAAGSQVPRRSDGQRLTSARRAAIHTCGGTRPGHQPPARKLGRHVGSRAGAVGSGGEWRSRSLAAISILLSVVDIREHRLPNKVVLPRPCGRADTVDHRCGLRHRSWANPARDCRNGHHVRVLPGCAAGQPGVHRRG